MNKKHLRRICTEVVLFAVFICILCFYLEKHAPNIIHLLTSGNITQIDDYLKQYGPEGKYLLVLLQVIETISIVLPASPVYICSGIMFGKIKGIVICYLTNLVLNVMIFLFARFMKESTRHTYNVNNNKFIGKMIEKARHMDRVVLAMCLLPVVPNGLIPYMSAQTKVTLPEFTRAMAIGSFPSLAVYVCCGDVLINFNYKIMLPVILVLIVLSAVAFLFRKKLIAALEPKIIQFLEG